MTPASYPANGQRAPYKKREPYLRRLSDGGRYGPVHESAKTVADGFRYERHVGLDVAMEALRDYFSMRRGGVEHLVEAARADRV
jgi:hypothetical protein